jgi:hypothetical protein
MEDLFYGNLDKSGLKVAKEILPSSYFLVDEFTQINYEPPSIDETEKEVKVLLNNFNINQLNKSIDKSLHSYLYDESVKLGISKSFIYKFQEIQEYVLNPIIMNLKEYWNRARPYQYAYMFSIPLHPYDTHSGHSPSYPSGHTLQAECWGALAKNLYPEKSTEISKVVNKVNKSRMELGVHFQSDIDFSKEICLFMIENEYLSLEIESYK